MNAYGLLLVVIMKIKTEKSLPLEKFNKSECRNITSIDMTIKKWNNIRGQFFYFCKNAPP